MTIDEVEFCERGLADIANAYGRIVAKDSEGRVLDCGSAIFLKVDGLPLIATAHHVVEGLARRGGTYLQVFDPTVMEEAENGIVPLEYPIDLSRQYSLSRGKILDVAALTAPAALIAHSGIKWFAAERHADALKYLRTMVPANVESQLSAMIVGFPRFARSDCEEIHVQTAGSIHLWVGLQRFVDPPSVLGLPSPLTMKLYGNEPEDFPEGTPERRCFEQLQELQAAGENALGGYSGGPLMYVCAQGPFLLGIVTEAVLEFGGQAHATPIDEFVREFRHSIEVRGQAN